MTDEAMLNRFAQIVADKVITGLTQGTECWRSQAGSPLGRKHNAAVRNRLKRGESGAAIVGRQHLLSREALAEELQRATADKAAQDKPAESSVVADLEADLAELELGDA